ncbi:MAG: class I SAM-dependent methyltransferase [Anaerolineales bacterium]
MHEKRFEGNIERLRAPERVERLQVERVTELCLEGQAIRSVLDVGTGSGLFAETFAGHGLAVAGVDVNPEMLAAASRFVPKGSFREGTAEALPFADGSFDLVFMGLVLHEADDTLKALQEAFRVAINRVGILEWPYRETVFGPPLADRLDPADLVDLFHQAGFRKWQSTDLDNTSLYRLER